MKFLLLFLMAYFTLNAMAQQTNTNSSIISLSQDFIYAAKTEDATDSLQQLIATLPYNDLVTGLKTDADKKAFWINLYNGFTQVLLTKDPEKYNSRNKFFKAKQNPIDVEELASKLNIQSGNLDYFKSLFTDKAPEDKDAPKPAILKEAASPGNVFLIADVDAFYDRFAYNVQNFGGTQMASPMSGNATLLFNLLDQATGSIGYRNEQVARIGWVGEDRHVAGPGNGFLE